MALCRTWFSLLYQRHDLPSHSSWWARTSKHLVFCRTLTWSEQVKTSFAQQTQMWANCPDWVQAIILNKLCRTIWAKMDKASAKKYLASDPSMLRPDASDVASAFSTPCAPWISLQRTQAPCASCVAWQCPLSPAATVRCTDALSTH